MIKTKKNNIPQLDCLPFMKKLLLIFTAILFNISCTPNEDISGLKVVRSESVFSKAGHEAYLTETKLNDEYQTQVLVKFSQGSCGSGALTIQGKILDMDILWQDESKLVAKISPEIEVTRNASGEYLKCGNQTIKVKIINS